MAVQIKPIEIKIREYHAILNQTGTNAPIATVLHNTLRGEIVWTRDGIGSYTGTLAGELTSGRTGIMTNVTNTATTVFCNENEDNSTVSILQVDRFNIDPMDGLYQLYVTIRVYTKND